MVQEPRVFVLESLKTSSYEPMQDAEIKYVFPKTVFVYRKSERDIFLGDKLALHALMAI